MNKVILMGRLTKDPELRYTQGNPGTAVCRYSLAVNRSYKRDGEPDADFFNCTTFGKTAEFANKYLRKGTMIAIVGELRNGSYTDRNGTKRYTTDIVVSEHYFTGSAGQSTASAVSSGSQDFAPAGAGYKTTTDNPTPQGQDQFVPIDTDLEGEEDLPF